MEKPLYKKWWFWVIAIFAALFIFGAITGIDEAKKDIESGEVNKIENENNEEVENESIQEDLNEEESVIEHDETFVFGEFTIENIVTEINDEELTFKFRWINQSGEDKMPFTALGYIDFLQGEEILRETSGAFDIGNKSGILFKNANGGGHSVTLVYKLMNDDPVKARFGATHEIDNTKEELIIEVD